MHLNVFMEFKPPVLTYMKAIKEKIVEVKGKVKDVAAYENVILYVSYVSYVLLVLIAKRQSILYLAIVSCK